MKLYSHRTTEIHNTTAASIKELYQRGRLSTHPGNLDPRQKHYLTDVDDSKSLDLRDVIFYNIYF